MKMPQNLNSMLKPRSSVDTLCFGCEKLSISRVSKPLNHSIEETDFVRYFPDCEEDVKKMDKINADWDWSILCEDRVHNDENYFRYIYPIFTSDKETFIPLKPRDNRVYALESKDKKVLSVLNVVYEPSKNRLNLLYMQVNPAESGFSKTRNYAGIGLSTMRGLLKEAQRLDVDEVSLKCEKKVQKFWEKIPYLEYQGPSNQYNLTYDYRIERKNFKKSIKEIDELIKKKSKEELSKPLERQADKTDV